MSWNDLMERETPAIKVLISVLLSFFSLFVYKIWGYFDLLVYLILFGTLSLVWSNKPKSHQKRTTKRKTTRRKINR